MCQDLHMVYDVQLGMALITIRLEIMKKFYSLSSTSWIEDISFSNVGFNQLN